MGSGRFNADDWTNYSTTMGYDKKETHEIFSKREIDKELDPFGVKVRESRDSKDNPKSNAIIIALDVTGSMGMISDTMARKGIPTLLTEIYDRKPVSDPHVMCMAIGDIDYGDGRHDQAPLQVTQFEADIRIATQLERFFLEGGGGGNSHESYSLAWYFAAAHTSIDCFEKRKKKGYLFTIGDELPTPSLPKKGIETFIGDKLQADLTQAEILTMVSRSYEIFHIIVEEGNFASGRKDQVFKAWQEVLGQRVIRLSDHTKLAEVVVSAIQVAEGVDSDEVAASWDGSTSLVVANAVRSISKSSSGSKGVISL